MSRNEVKFTRDPEQWSNGLYCQWFECDGVEYSLKQHYPSASDDKEYTHLGREEPQFNGAARSAWMKCPLKHGRVFDCIITPSAAIEIIILLKRERRIGADEGAAFARRTIKEALGIL